jgi:hypothetical protein
MLIRLSVSFQAYSSMAVQQKRSWNSLMRYRYRFTQFKKRQPEKFNSVTNRILLDLADLEKAVNELNDSGRRHKAS